MDKRNTCSICGTTLVPAKDKITLSGSLQLDGSWDFDNKVCPKCHPELVKAEQN